MYPSRRRLVALWVTVKEATRARDRNHSSFDRDAGTTLVRPGQALARQHLRAGGLGWIVRPQHPCQTCLRTHTPAFVAFNPTGRHLQFPQRTCDGIGNVGLCGSRRGLDYRLLCIDPAGCCRRACATPNQQVVGRSKRFSIRGTGPLKHRICGGATSFVARKRGGLTHL